VLASKTSTEPASSNDNVTVYAKVIVTCTATPKEGTQINLNI
jgi:hypothetical protein